VERKIRGLAFICNGYGMECTVYSRKTGQTLASSGYAVYGIDYEGHGKSEGLRAYVPNFDELVNDCNTFFNSVMDREEYACKPSFLVGESMGGAVAVMIALRNRARWSGLVLVAPMLKISEKMKPPQALLPVLIKLCNIIPTWRITPTKDIIDTAYRDTIKRDEIRCNPYAYQGGPRLATAYQLYKASSFIQAHLAEVSLPFICIHGLADCVNEPEASKMLFDSASSLDKTLKLYPDMWHGLLTGEPQENIDLVFDDITQWLKKGSSSESCSPTIGSNTISAFADSKVKFNIHGSGEETTLPVTLRY
jgi:alpha-beta hydrolase superfamily lysophospholipase